MSSENSFDCTCGSSFVLSGHLWVVVISEAIESPKQVIAVYLTTKKTHSDTTIILTSEDHKFIKHDTVLSYADARIMEVEMIKKRIEDKFFKPHDKFKASIISKIQKGLIDSPHTPREIKDFFMDNEDSKA